MNYFSAYIYSIIGIKLLFILMAVIHIILKIKGKINSSLAGIEPAIS